MDYRAAAGAFYPGALVVLIALFPVTTAIAQVPGCRDECGAWKGDCVATARAERATESAECDAALDAELALCTRRACRARAKRQKRRCMVKTTKAFRQERSACVRDAAGCRGCCAAGGMSDDCVPPTTTTITSSITTTSSSTTTTLQCPGGVIGDPEGQASIAVHTAVQASGGGANGRVSGTVQNVDAKKVAVVCYAFTDCAYVQPFTASWRAHVCSDGTWSTATHAWGRLACLLVDATTFEPPAKVCTARDDELCNLPGVLACDRHPAPRRVEFSGATWEATDSDPYKTYCPGICNVFANSEENVSSGVDGLRLRTVKQGDVWTSSEAFVTQAVGFGVYTMQLASDPTAVDPNEVAGVFFIYASPTEEIDGLECSRALDIPATYDCQYVVQPPLPDRRYSFRMQGIAESTHRVVWALDRVEFTSWKGFASYPPAPADVVASWVFTGSGIPPSRGFERVRSNLWRPGDKAPQSGIGGSFLVKSLTYAPLP